MRPLVAVASRHGSTAAIGERVGDVIDRKLRDRGITARVEVRSLGDVETLDGYDAVVLGSAVYMGRWLTEAHEFAVRHAAELATRPVWLFSSGGIGDPPKPDADPEDVGPLMDLTHARAHRRWAGRLDRSQLGLRERAVIAAVRAPDGDFRDWPAIEAWAAGIADELVDSVAPR